MSVVRVVEVLQRPGAKHDFIHVCAAAAGNFAFGQIDAELLRLLFGDAKDGRIRHIPAALEHAVGLDQRHDGVHAFNLFKLRHRLFVQLLLAGGPAAVSGGNIGPGVDADGHQAARSGKALDGRLLDADAKRHHDNNGSNADDHAEYGQKRSHFSPPQV